MAMITAVCDVTTKTVWIIPKDMIEGKQTIRLGQQYEEFVVPEPLSRSFQEQKGIRCERLRMLKEQAMKVANKFADGKE